jgi:hypothetical protein
MVTAVRISDLIYRLSDNHIASVVEMKVQDFFNFKIQEQSYGSGTQSDHINITAEHPAYISGNASMSQHRMRPEPAKVWIS